MKSPLRYLALLIAGVLGVGVITGCAPPGSRRSFPNTFEDARKLEATDPKGAVQEFAAIKDAYSGKDDTKAAQALWEAAQFSANPALYGTPAQVQAGDKLTPDVQAQITEMHTEGLKSAHESLKQLRQQFSASPLAAQAEAKNPPPGIYTLPVIEQQLDSLSSKNFSYQLIDRLVALTGRKPAFSYWFALLLIAVIVKALTMPLTLKMYKSQREMQRLQPQLKELQKRYKEKPTELNAKMMEFYKENNVSPFASCLPMVIQLPFMWWVYEVIRLYEYHFSNGTFLWVGSSLSHTYPGIVGANLARFDVPLLLLYAASNFFTMRLTPSPDPTQAQQQKMMSVWMSLIMLFMFFKYQWSAAFIFYWLVLNIISTSQQYHYIYKPNRLRLATGDTLIVPSASERRENASNRKATKGDELAAAAARPSGATPASTAMRPRPKRKRR